jgi:hypothetical protein
MDPTDFVKQIRAHYVDQFREFVRRQKQSSSKNASEVKLRLSDESEIFQHLYCVDVIKNDGEPQIVELQPDRVLSFEALSGSFGDADLTIEHLRWDDVVIHHDAPEPLEGLAQWFDNWFDPDDRRHDASAELGNVIHSLLVQPGTLSLDMGTAEADAFWDALDLVGKAGARNICVSASRAEASDSYDRNG